MTPARQNLLRAKAAITDDSPDQWTEIDLTSCAFVTGSKTVHQLDAIFRAALGATDDTAAMLPGACAEVAPFASDTALDAEAIQRLGATLSSDPRDEVTLLFLYKLGCREGPWTLRYDQWQSGCAELCIFDRSGVEKQYALCVEEYDRMNLRDPEFFEYYKFLFDFVKAPSARCISVEDATTLWETVLIPRWPGGQAWIDFVQSQAIAKRGIFKDLWTQLITFACSMTWPSCPEADADTSWPSLIDAFVDHCRHPPVQSNPELVSSE